MRRHVVFGALVVLGADAAAAPVKLGEHDLRSAVAGKTVKIDTPLGVPLTVSYGANGIMSGTVGTVLAAYLGSAKDRGRWAVRNGLLCQKWFKWLDAEETCMEVRQDGHKILWRTDTGKTGTAMIEPGPPMLDGATAYGLGAPARPDPPEAGSPPAEDPSEQRPAPPAVAIGTPAPPLRHDEVAPHAPPVQRHHVAVAALPRTTHAPAAAEKQAPAAAAEEPRLIDPPREIIRASPAAWRPLHDAAVATVAIALPPSPAMSPAPRSHEVSEPDGEPLQANVPMRAAAEIALADSLEHRWCQKNALATALAFPAAESDVTARFAGAPSLLAVSVERLYPAELPLPEPACLTSAPALLVPATTLAHE